MNYIKIYKTAITDGPGVRVSLYVSGCRNHCKGCHNPESWDFNFGKVFNQESLNELLAAIKPSYIAGLTICGGEPFEEENQKVLVDVIKKVRETYPNKNIWCYTGYEYEDLLEGGKKHIEVTKDMLKYIDVLITGPFILELMDITENNKWRGSTNQKIIDLNKIRSL